MDEATNAAGGDIAGDAETKAFIAERYERARKVLREARWRRHDRVLYVCCIVTARKLRREAREARQRIATA
jgi:hypothetical protein